MPKNPTFEQVREIEAMLQAFTGLMQIRMEQNVERGMRNDWLGQNPNEIIAGLGHAFLDLKHKVNAGDAEAAITQAADVANYAMIVAEWFTHYGRAHKS